LSKKSCSYNIFLKKSVRNIRFVASPFFVKNSWGKQTLLSFGNVAERVKEPFLRQPCDHDRVILVQLPPSSHTLLGPWIRRFSMIISA